MPPPERELPNTSLFEILAGGNVPTKKSESAVIKHMATLQIKHDLHLHDLIYLGFHFDGGLFSHKSGRVSAPPLTTRKDLFGKIQDERALN